MSNFYARYVPPAKKTDTTSAPPQPEKRKRDPTTSSREKESKKLKTSKRTQVVEDGPSTSVPHGDLTTAGNAENTGTLSTIDKYRVTKAASNGNTTIKIKKRKSNVPEDEDRNGPVAETSDQRVKSKHKSKPEEAEAGGGNAEDEHDRRHAAVFSKLERARQNEKKLGQQPEPSSEQPAVELHGLEPIPQPKQVDAIPEKPTYSTLPPWQETPTTVPLDTTATFESLGISGTPLENLQKANIHQAFPIQASVIPLLLNGPSKHEGDLCVSAATGSGKTLAYVLPIIDSLRNAASTKLRAVIVVPTRELVKQVRELCEVCASGTSLTIATAVGSKSLKDEQENLVEEQRIYDPEQYQKQMRAKVDWSTFSLEKLLRKAQTEDLIASIGYVTCYKSKADILITTPGRLVDHLKSTAGFTLGNVKWLVVDEADRLLNESYQEWIDSVIPALKSQAATQERDELLRSMRMTPPKRKVTKVLLSATMTRDVSKLNALELRNPSLIILGGSSENNRSQQTASEVLDNGAEPLPEGEIGAFYLPPSLGETALPIPDGSEKPLYLLKLLRDHIGIVCDPAHAQDQVLDASSSDSSSDSDSESDSSSDSATDSDTSSDSETSSSSDDASSTASAKSRDGKSPAQTRPNSQNIREELSSNQKKPRALIFARSTASANRLSRLLALLCPSLEPLISTLTRSTASSASSRRALSSFRSAKISILICTDRASRGLDVPDLEHVISYDVPNSGLTYVHRVGRTARAGKQGEAWTMVEHREGAWFWREIGGKGQRVHGATGDEHQLQRHSKIKRLTLSIEDEVLRQSYEKALKTLGEEARGG
nr:ATP-dependent RNA helicase dbp6 [Exophiala xenobiotica]